MKPALLLGVLLLAHAPGRCGCDTIPEVPEPYAGLTNPYDGDEVVLAAGELLWAERCASCHGPTAAGDGPQAADLSPPPTDLADENHAHLADDYLYWRIAEGGRIAPFDSAMPAYKDELDEEAIWSLVTYLRHLAAEAGHDHDGHSH